MRTEWNNRRKPYNEKEGRKKMCNNNKKQNTVQRIDQLSAATSMRWDEKFDSLLGVGVCMSVILSKYRLNSSAKWRTINKGRNYEH